MRLNQAIAVCTTVVALTTMTACGGADGTGKQDGGKEGANTAETTGQAGKSTLPKAADMASIAQYVKQYTPCESLQPGEEYDSNNSSSNDSWGTAEAPDPSWGIKERAVCTDDTGHPVTLLSIQDIKKFQNSAKRDSWEFMVGSDFAVVPVGDEAYEALQQSDLKLLTCDPEFTPLRGFTKEPAAVDGCVLSNYFPS